MAPDRWDIFISHASEDKAELVQPLAGALSAFGLRVWYDEFTLSLGDSLSRSIDKGLARSDFGVVVLSRAFFQKQWPEYELRGLTAREFSGSKVILPIWHNVGRDEVMAFSPPLADKFAVNSAKLSPVQLAIAVIEVVKPDLFRRIHRRLLFLQAIRTGVTKELDLGDITIAPVRHPELSDDLVGRIRLVRAALLAAYPHSMEFWLDGFRRDTHPSTEVALWEHVGAVFIEYRAMTKLTADQYGSVFKVVLNLMIGANLEELADHLSKLPPDAGDVISSLWKSKVPPYDIEEKSPFVEREDKDVQLPEDEDRETFPDVPDNLLRPLLRDGNSDKQPK